MSNTAQERLTANINTLLTFTKRRQVALADHMGVSQPLLSMYLNGKRLWQVDDLDRVADFFTVTVGDLFRDAGGMFERRSGAERRGRFDRRQGNWRNATVITTATTPRGEREDQAASQPYGRPPGTTPEQGQNYGA